MDHPLVSEPSEPYMRPILASVLLYAAFVALSPGVLLTLPPVTLDFCVHGHPKSLKHRPVLFSGRSSPLSVFVHAVIYTGVAYCVLAGVGGIAWSRAWAGALVFGGAFFILAPGLLLTLPPLADTVCDKGAHRPHYRYFVSGRSGVVAALVQGCVATLAAWAVVTYALPEPYDLRT